MALQEGTTLGAYEIVAQIGAGGMGEVYRARDRKLNRDVAIKILPAALAADPVARARFEREAQAVAALSHPNVLGIFDFGIAGDTPYAVMELLDGITLRDVLASEIAPRRAIEYARQIAAGLGAAHQRGITHRDLKPENVFVTRDGRVKILDFGLAKPTQAWASSASTRAAALDVTAAGTIVGTVGYMSPEQVRGLEVDHRSDIFSFGAVLYELLAGRRAFLGDSPVETMNAILKEDVPDSTVSGAALPPALDRIVRRCLEKNPDERFQSASDVGFALEAVSASRSDAAVPAAEALPSPRQRALRFAGAVVLLAAVAALSYVAGRVRAPTAALRLTRLTWERGTVRSARFSPDGSTVIYGAAWGGAPIRVFQTRLGSPESIALRLPDADVFAIAPNGEMAIGVGRRFDGWIGYGTLARVALVGGTPRAVLDQVSDADWGPKDGRLAVLRRVNGKFRLEFPIGVVLYETTGYLSHVRVSRGGDAVAFIDHPVYGDNRGAVALVTTAGRRTTLTKEWAGVEGLAWSADGREVWYAAADESLPTIRAVSRAGVDREVWAAPAHLTILDVAPDGRVLATANSLHTEIRWTGAGDVQARDLSWFADTALADVGGDGRSVLLSRFDEGAGVDYQMGLRRVDEPSAISLGIGRGLQLSPDARWALGLTFGVPGLIAWPTGTGERRTFATAGLTYETAGWFPDGRRILAIASHEREGSAAYAVDFADGVPHRLPTKILPDYTYFVKVSPDGTRFFGARSGSPPVIVNIDGDVTPLPGLTTADSPIGWTSDGRGVIVARRSAGLAAMTIARVELGSGRVDPVRTLTITDPAGLRAVDVGASADGRTVVYAAQKYLTDLYVVEGLK